MSGGLIIWFVGLSGAGKSTIAEIATDSLHDLGFSVEVVDGYRLRQASASALGFSTDAVMKSNELAIKVCSDLRQKCDVVLVSRISPNHLVRRLARQALAPGFFEVYIKASLKTVRSRDPKGLYESASRGQTDPMIGMPDAAPFEVPISPDLVLDTESHDPQYLAAALVDFIQEPLNSDASIGSTEATERARKSDPIS